ncbi:MAG: hypothetical protein AAF900_00305 [Bacteroidota bacterium]
MAAITFLRDKKWIITGFALLGIGLLFLSAIPAIYHNTSQDKDSVFVEGKYYTKEQYKQLLAHFRYDEQKLQQHLRQETLTKQILAETGAYVTDQDVQAIMYNADDEHVQQVLKQYYQVDNGDYTPPLQQIKTSDKQTIKRYKGFLKKALQATKANQFLNQRPQSVLFEKKAKKKNISYRRISLTQIITDDTHPTPQEQKDFLRQNQHLFSTKMFTKVLFQTFSIPPSYQEVKHAEQHISKWRKEFQTTKDPKGYAKRCSDNPEEIIKEWDKDKTPHFLRNKPIGYVSNPKKVRNQYKMYRIKETKNSEGKFVVYQITKHITCKDNLPHIKKRVEALQKEHRTQNYDQIHTKYGYYLNHKGNQNTIDIHPHMVNYPPNSAKGAIARKIFQDHYKRGQYFSIEIKDNKTNATQEILLCTPLYRGKGNTLDYNPKKVQDSIKAKRKLQTLKKDIPRYTEYTATTKKQKIAQKYGSAPWINNKTITLEDTKLYSEPYPKEITKILEDENPPSFYAFLDKANKHVIVVITNHTEASTVQTVTQGEQKPQDRFQQYNTTYI